MSENILNHEKYTYANDDIASELSSFCKKLDQQHPLERKIKFLLDVRGYIKVNKIQGSYVEFGSFRSEMQYCAYDILEKTNCILNYVGLDTFSGEPEMNESEIDTMRWVSAGSFESSHNLAQKFIKKNIGKKAKLIKGDFRKAEIIKKCDAYLPINVAVIDCNLTSSIKTSLEYSLKKMVSGGIIFIDDYFTNFSTGKPVVHDIFIEACKKHGVSFIDHQFYSPFAKSFIIYRR